MSNNDKLIESFFKEYERRFADALNSENIDIEGQATAFSNCFIGANPHGVQCLQNDEEFRKNIPKQYQFYKSIGTRSMKLSSLDLTQINEYHSLVKTYLTTDVVKKDDSVVTIEFDNHYLVQVINSTVKIFAYITDDEQKVLSDHGIEPYK